MWLFTKHGFYSVVKKDEQMHVRARRLTHLDKLKRIAELDSPTVVTAHADYRYRMVMPVDVWQRLAATLVADIDYPNFKDVVRDPTYHRAAEDVWSRMRDLQRQGRRS